MLEVTITLTEEQAFHMWSHAKYKLCTLSQTLKSLEELRSIINPEIFQKRQNELNCNFNMWVDVIMKLEVVLDGSEIQETTRG